MDREYLEELINPGQGRRTAGREGAESPSGLPVRRDGFAAVDSHRALRTGYAEVVFCQGKTPAQVVAITEKLAKSGLPVLATRATPETYNAVLSQFPNVRYSKSTRTITIPGKKPIERRGTVPVVTAGTADVPVAEEAVVTAEGTGVVFREVYEALLAAAGKKLG